MWEWLSAANDALLSFATSFEGTPWLFVVMWLFIALDGICPIFPSESLVIGVVALSVSVGQPNIWIVFAVAIAGAICGDLTAYSIGRALGRRHYAVFERPRVAKVIEWAQCMVARRPAPVIISARYIPVGRVVVNFTAGKMRFPRRAFGILVTIAAVTWSAYSSMIGIGAGHWLEGHPLIAVVAGVAGGVLLGMIVDRVIRWYLDFNQKKGRELSEGLEQLDAVTGKQPAIRTEIREQYHRSE